MARGWKAIRLGSSKAGKLESGCVSELPSFRASQLYSIPASQPLSYLPDTQKLLKFTVWGLRGEALREDGSVANKHKNPLRLCGFA